MNTAQTRNEWLFKLIAYVVQNYPAEQVRDAVHSAALQHQFTVDECDGAIAFFLEQAARSLPSSSQPVIALPSSSQPVIALPSSSQPAVAPPTTQPTSKAREQLERTLERDSFVDDKTFEPPNDEIHELGQAIQDTYSDFGISLTYEKKYQSGPRFHQLQFKLGRGNPFNKLSNYTKDLVVQAGLSDPEKIIVLPCSGFVGIQIPRNPPRFCPLTSYVKPRNSQATDPIVVPLGVDVSDNLIRYEMSHMLIGGMTGSGKSLLESAIIASLMLWYRPEHLQMVLIDPMGTEFADFEGIPWLWPWQDNPHVITEANEAKSAILALLQEHKERCSMLRDARVKNIQQYNQKHPHNSMPFIVCLIDEYYKLKFPIPELEDEDAETVEENKKHSKFMDGLLIRGSQETRKTGIFFVVATQRPERRVIDPIIRDNLPLRIALSVSSPGNSQIILGDNSDEGKLARYLEGKGDMWVQEGSTMKRLQSLLIDEKFIKQLLEISKQRYPAPRQTKPRSPEEYFAATSPPSIDPDWQLYQELEALVRQHGSDRKALSIKYNIKNPSGKYYETLNNLRAKYGGG